MSYQTSPKHGNIKTAERQAALARKICVAHIGWQWTLTIAEWREWSGAWRLCYFLFPHLLKERKRSWLQLATEGSQRQLGDPKFQKTGLPQMLMPETVTSWHFQHAGLIACECKHKENLDFFRQDLTVQTLSYTEPGTYYVDQATLKLKAIHLPPKPWN